MALAAAKVALDTSWAIFMEDKPGGRGNWTLDQKYRNDNPGELEKLLAYKNGGARPTLTTATGRRMVEVITAIRELKDVTVPPPAPAPVPVPKGIHPSLARDYDLVVLCPGPLTVQDGWWTAQAFLTTT